MPQLMSVPNLLSLSRIIMAGFMYWAVSGSEWYIAVTILWLAIFTDVLDGYLARRQEVLTPLGGLFDHGSDAMTLPSMPSRCLFDRERRMKSGMPLMGSAHRDSIDMG